MCGGGAVYRLSLFFSGCLDNASGGNRRDRQRNAPGEGKQPSSGAALGRKPCSPFPFSRLPGAAKGWAAPLGGKVRFPFRQGGDPWGGQGERPWSRKKKIFFFFFFLFLRISSTSNTFRGSFPNGPAEKRVLRDRDRAGRSRLAGKPLALVCFTSYLVQCQRNPGTVSPKKRMGGFHRKKDHGPEGITCSGPPFPP